MQEDYTKAHGVWWRRDTFASRASVVLTILKNAMLLQPPVPFHAITMLYKSNRRGARTQCRPLNTLEVHQQVGLVYSMRTQYVEISATIVVDLLWGTSDYWPTTID